MLFYTLGFVLFILFALANLRYSGRDPSEISRKNKKYNAFVLTIAVLTFFIIANESIKSNGDLQGYYNHYNSLSHVKFDYFFRNWSDMKDPFYHLCGFLTSKIGLDFYGWHTVIAFVSAFAIYNLISRYSTNVFISLTTIFVLGLFGFILSGLRQALALSVLMFSFTFLREKKLICFILVVLLASLFHSTALIFIVAYPVYQMKFNYKNLVLMCLGGIVVLLNAGGMVSLYLKLVGTDDIYSGYTDNRSGLTVSGTVISGFVLVFCLVFMFLGKSKAKNPQICYLLLISFFTNILSVIWFAEFFRISMYFSLFECIAIAEACTCEKNIHNNQIKTLCCSLALFAYYFVARPGNVMNYVGR